MLKLYRHPTGRTRSTFLAAFVSLREENNTIKAGLGFSTFQVSFVYRMSLL